MRTCLHLPTASQSSQSPYHQRLHTMSTCRVPRLPTRCTSRVPSHLSHLDHSRSSNRQDQCYCSRKYSTPTRINSRERLLVSLLHLIHDICVVDPGCLSRKRLFSIPDPKCLSRNPDLHKKLKKFF